MMPPSGQPAPRPAAAPRPARPAETGEAWTTRTLLAWMAGAFQARKLDSPRLFAEMLLAHALGCDRLRLYMEADRPATPIERELLRGLVSRALAHEPVHYLVGEAWFFSLPFTVDRRVLVPRPSSETIVEHVLQTLRAEPGLAPGGTALIADICTGSGCLAIALLKNLPHARAIATDLSPDALDVARLNASRHGVADRIELLQGDLFAPLADHPTGSVLNVLVSNPPYIPDHEWPAVPLNVKDHEPGSALRAGPDGLRFVRPLIENAPDHLLPGGLLLIELAASTAPAVLELARANPRLSDPRIIDDFEGHPRVLVGRRAG